MGKTFMVWIGIIFTSIPADSQTYTCYNDSIGPLTREWCSNCDYTEKTANDAFEGTKYLDYTYSQYSFVVHYPAAWMQITKRFDASNYKYIQFACKINTEKTVPDTLSFWCIHCDASKSRDMFFTSKFAFKPTTAWKVIKVPMSAFAQDPVDMISSIVFIFSGPDGSRHFYVDDIKFTNSDPVTVRPLMQRDMTGQPIFLRGDAIKTETYSLNGIKINCGTVECSATTAYRGSLRNSAKKLRAGAYIIRQSVQSGNPVLKVTVDKVVSPSF